MIRLFVAVPLPEDVRGSLAGITAGVPGARWTPVENLHLTLRFIGEVPEPDFHDIAEALSTIEGAPFSIRIKGVGQFGDRRRAKMLWAGIEPAEQVQLLRNRVENRLTRLGLEPEGRKYMPHITLARLKDSPVDRVGRYLFDNGRFETPFFEVARFALFSSHLGQAGGVNRPAQAPASATRSTSSTGAGSARGSSSPTTGEVRGTDM
jgi:2'-5' RNA ligase